MTTQNPAAEGRSSFSLGIDTGGTFTDAVILERNSGEILASAKALTTYHDLSLGISRAVTEVLDRLKQDHGAADIDLVGLSTTLATNSVVEGYGGRVCLVLIGYDPELVETYGLSAEFATRDIVYIAGGHDENGEEASPLDESAVRRTVGERRGKVDAYAVSGYFGVRNPAHEIRAKAVIEELTGGKGDFPCPVTCGHELTTRLDSVRRAMTAVLNAGLIPLLKSLISTVGTTLKELGIDAPLMVVKGDGSLVKAEWAMNRPIETILSGPAASVVGAYHLVNRPDMWVVDIGGTTTDIALMEGGKPRLNREGARVDRWRTMVEAIDTRTVGLGGDSWVTYIEENSGQDFPYTLGPRRVVPLCSLADSHPSIISELRRQSARGVDSRLAGRFIFLRNKDDRDLTEKDLLLLEILEKGPCSLEELSVHRQLMYVFDLLTAKLLSRGIISESAFTPTDALHVTGAFDRWNREASVFGAEMLARRKKMEPRDFCFRIISEVSCRVCEEIIQKISDVPPEAPLLDLALGKTSLKHLSSSVTLTNPIAGIGAPVAAYIPRAGELMHTESIILPHSDVANAVGAVVGGIVQRIHVTVQPLETEGSFVYRFHLPGEIKDFADLDGGVESVRGKMESAVGELARSAGAEHIHVEMSRKDSCASSAGGHNDIYLESELLFTATGRPSSAYEA